MHDNPYFVTQGILTQTEPDWGHMLGQMKSLDNVLKKHCNDVANKCKAVVYGGMWTTFWEYEGIQELMEELVTTTFAEYRRFPKRDLNAKDLGEQFIRTFLHFHYGDSKLVGCFLKHDEFEKLPVGLIKTVNVYFAHTLNDSHVSALKCKETLDIQIETEVKKNLEFCNEWDKPAINCIANYSIIRTALHKALLHLGRNIVFLPWCSEWKNIRNFFLPRGPGSLLLDRNDAIFEKHGYTPVYKTFTGKTIRFDCPYGSETIKAFSSLDAKDTMYLIKQMFLQDTKCCIDRLSWKQQLELLAKNFFIKTHYPKCYDQIDSELKEFENRYLFQQDQWCFVNVDDHYRQISSSNVTSSTSSILTLTTGKKSRRSKNSGKSGGGGKKKGGKSFNNDNYRCECGWPWWKCHCEYGDEEDEDDPYDPDNPNGYFEYDPATGEEVYYEPDSRRTKSARAKMRKKEAAGW